MSQDFDFFVGVAKHSYKGNFVNEVLLDATPP
jgi:hypothetical protein